MEFVVGNTTWSLDDILDIKKVMNLVETDPSIEINEQTHLYYRQCLSQIFYFEGELDTLKNRLNYIKSKMRKINPNIQFEESKFKQIKMKPLPFMNDKNIKKIYDMVNKHKPNTHINYIVSVQLLKLLNEIQMVKNKNQVIEEEIEMLKNKLNELK